MVWMSPIHPGEGNLFTWYMDLNLFSSRNTLTGIPKIMFNQVSGHPLAQLSWHIKLIITFNTHFGGKKYRTCWLIVKVTGAEEKKSKGPCCDIVTCNKKYTFDSWHTAPKTHEIFWVIKAMEASFLKVIFGLFSSVLQTASELYKWHGCPVIHYQVLFTAPGLMLVSDFWKAPEDGASCQGNQLCVEGWNFQSHPLVSRKW